MSTTEDRTDLNTVETEDTVAIDVNAAAQAADTATVDPGVVPGTVSPLGAYDGNVPPKV